MEQQRLQNIVSKWHVNINIIYQLYISRYQWLQIFVFFCKNSLQLLHGDESESRVNGVKYDIWVLQKGREGRVDPL